jgi:hypothetical protein
MNEKLENAIDRITTNKPISLVHCVSVNDGIGNYVYNKFPLAPNYLCVGKIGHYYTPEEKDAVDAWHFEYELSSEKTTWVLLTWTGGRWFLDKGIANPILFEPCSVLGGIARFLVDIIGECINKNGSKAEYLIYSLPLKPLEGKDGKWTITPMHLLHKDGFYVDVSLKERHWEIKLIARSLIGLKIFDPDSEKQIESPNDPSSQQS